MSLTDSGHWYYRSGEPAHQLPTKKDPSQLKNTTLGDAKKLGLVPSVTTILKAVANFNLSSWRERTLLSTAYENKGVNLPLDQWSAMVKESAFAQVGQAADEGTQYHLVIESIVNNVDLPDYELTIPVEFFTGFSSWWHGMKLETYQTEVSFAHHDGFGGRMDFVGYDEHGRDVFVDWKTQDTKHGKPAGFYRDSYPVQLAAYMEGYRDKVAKNMEFVYNPRLISVVISRSEPGRIEHVEWPEDNHKAYLDAFYNILGWWKYVNEYDPSWEE